MKKKSRFVFSILFVIMALTLVFAFAACGGSGDDVPSGDVPGTDIPSQDEPQAGQTYGYGEQGTYYMDTSDGEYLLVVEYGEIIVSVGGEIGDKGTYTCDGSGAMTITFGSDTQTASYKDGAVTVNVQGTNYTFLLRTEYEVTFVSDTGDSSVTVVNGRAAERPADPEKEGYAFLGWYEDSAYTVKYDFTTGITQDTTLYARFEKYSESGEFEITFMDGNTVIGSGSTIGGKVLEFPQDGSWWVSDTENGDKLTYKYTDEVLDENTTLFLNNSYAIGVSVTESGVHVENVMGNMSITIVSPDGTRMTATFASKNFSYDFSSLSEGEYEVTVSYGTTAPETAYYTNKALARASIFTVTDSRVLMWNEIVGAAYYTVSISCGSISHTHEDIYVGTNRYYDFSDCDMPKDGIVFTVTAYADGYVSSTGSYTYFKGLDMVAVSVSGDVLTWTDVSGAMGYEIYIDGEYAVTTSMTSYSLKAYAPGTYSLSVKPVTQGYYSEETAYTYSKTSVAAPGITSVEGGVISWNAVDGASYYAVMIDGVVVASSVSATSFAVSDSNLDSALSVHTVSVRAIPGSGSQYTASEYSDPMSFTKDYMGSALTYSDGVITWQYSLDAVCYIVTVNNEDETEVYGQNSAKITLTKSGDNEIAVKYVDAYGNYSVAAQISVYAYAIIFDARGGVTLDENGAEIEVIYVAQGDTVYLPTPEYGTGSALFGGWYTLPDLSFSKADDYKGDGVLFSDGAVFTGNSTLVLYAFWNVEKFRITLDAGDYGVVDGETIYDFDIPVEERDYEIPVAEPTDAAKVFYGWYSEPNGRGTRFTDENGVSRISYTNQNITTLYAYWITVLDFEVTTYQGQQYASVSAGENIALVSEVTVPAKYTIGGTEYTVGYVGSTAFNRCSSLTVINLPDTLLYISTANDGYLSGTGAFASSANIEEVNIIPYEGTYERFYYSADGVLFHKTDEKSVELLYYPHGKASASYVIPETVSNEYETEYTDGQQTQVILSVTSLATKVFYNNVTLVSVSVPATVSEIASGAFQACTKVTSFIFLDECVSADAVAADRISIADDAFKSCNSLAEITLPARFTDFSAAIFENCSSLKNIYVSSGNAVFSSDNGLLCTDGGRTVVFCPRGREGEVTFGTGVTTIEKEAFYKCTSVTSVTFHSGIVLISESAFEGCTALTSVTFLGDDISPNLTIETRAFYGCTSSRFTEIYLPSNLVALGVYAFGNCTYLTTVHFDARARSEGDTDELDFAVDAFATTAGRSYVKNLYLGANVPEIEFAGIFGSSLAYVSIDDGNPYYSSDEEGVVFNADKTSVVFYPSEKTGGYTIPDTVTTISAGIFRGRTNLTYVYIPASVTYIGENAFYGCTALTGIEFALTGGTYLEIGDSAFYNCSSLTEITLPSWVSRIGGYDDEGALVSMDVFEGCSNLETIAVDGNCSDFCTTDGVLYMMKDGEASELLVSPRKNSGSNGAVVVPSTVTKVWGNAFSRNEKITSFRFENDTATYGVEFGEDVFYLSAVKELYIPVGTKAIPVEFARQATDLEYVYIPYTVETIDHYAFYYDTALVKVEFGVTPEGTNEVSLSFVSTVSGSDGKAFANCSSLTEIILPDRTKELGAGTFHSCKALASVTIGSDTEEIPYQCFYGCSSLTTVTFSGGAGSRLTTIGEQAFVGTGSLSIVLPANVTTIEDYAFGGEYSSTSASKITYIKINKNIESIGKYAFENCKYLAAVEFEAAEEEDSLMGLTIGENAFQKTAITELTLPSYLLDVAGFNGITSLKSVTFTDAGYGIESFMISSGAFEGDTALIVVTLAAGLTSIGDKAFSGCTALVSVSIPSSVISVGAEAFGGCTSLTSAYFAVNESGYSSLSSIGADAFMKTALTSFTFPEVAEGSVIELGASIFRQCQRLTTVTLSNGVTALGTAFNYCYSIENIVIPEGNDNYKMAEDGSPILYNGDGTEIAFIYGEISGSLEIEDTVTEIGSEVFMYQNTLRSVTIPAGVTEIGDYAFYGCTALETVIFKGNADDAVSVLGTIDEGAFMNCTSLKEIIIPATVYELGTKAFYGDVSLESVSFGTDGGSDSQMATIGTYAFSHCSSLKEITLPLGVVDLKNGSTSANSYAFEYCTSLEKVVFLGELNSIGLGAFQYCSSLVTLGTNGTYTEGVVDLSDVNYLASSAFAYSGIQSLYLGSGDFTKNVSGSSSQTQMFIYCEELTEINFSNASTTLAKGMFAYCTSLEYLALNSNIALTAGTNVTSAANYGVFTGCSSLETLITGGVNFTAYSFYGCSSLRTVANSKDSVVEGIADLSGVLTLGNYVFTNCESLTTVILSDVTSFGTYDFQNCTGLETVVLPAGCSLGNYDFNGCTSLTTVTDTASYMGQDYKANVADLSGVSSFGTNCFQGCTSLTTVVLPDSCSIGSSYNTSAYLFADCTSLVTVTNGTSYQSGNYTAGVADLSSVILFSRYGFQNCASLEFVVLPNSVGTSSSNTQTLGNYTFTGCTSLTTVTDAEAYANGDYVKGIANLSGIVYAFGTNCFQGCTSLTTVILPDNSTLQNYMFEGCTSLTTVTGAAAYQSGTWTKGVVDLSSVSTLATYTFQNCTGIETVVLSDGCAVTDHLFQGCTSLATVTDVTSYQNKDYVEGVADLSCVKSIGVASFSSCDGLTDIIFADGISLGRSAFSLCDNLDTLVFSQGMSITSGTTGATASDTNINNLGSFAHSGVKTIILNDLLSVPNYTFYGCESLTTVATSEALLKDGVMDISSLTTVGTHAFEECTGITTVVLPTGEITLSESAFADCSALTTIGPVNTQQDTADFRQCTSLAVNCIAGTAVTTLYLGTLSSSVNGLFADIESLQSVDLTEDITLSKAMFAGCTSLTTVVADEYATVQFTAGSGTSGTNRGVFEDCVSLETVDIDGLVTIGAYTFYGCTSLKNIDLSSVTEIGNYGFYECASLEYADLSSIDSIGSYAFNGCVSLQIVVMSEDNSDLYFVDGLIIDGDGTVLFMVGDAEHVDVPEGVTSIGAYAFYYSPVTTVTLPSTLETIGNYAFYMSSLVSIEITASVTSIGQYAFAGIASRGGSNGVVTIDELNSLEEIIFLEDDDNENAAELTIGTYAFSGAALKSVELPDRLTSLGASSFIGTLNLESFTFGTGITAVPDYMLMGSGIGYIEIPEYITSVGQYSFCHCESLTEIIFNDGFTTIGNYAFEYCYSLESVTLPGTVTSVGTSAFADDYSIVTVVLEEGITALGSGYIFDGTTSLKNLSLPSTLETLNNYMFMDSGLDSIIIPSGISEMGSGVFSGWTAEQTIYLSVSSVYESLHLYGDISSTDDDIGTEAWRNDCGALICYYSEMQPADDGYTYWHYAEDGVTPVIW